jgi:hypothetical protein
MIDRRWVTDLGLAALIAIPAVLPAATTPRSAETEVATAQHMAPMVEASASERSGELPG